MTGRYELEKQEPLIIHHLSQLARRRFFFSPRCEKSRIRWVWEGEAVSTEMHCNAGIVSDSAQQIVMNHGYCLGFSEHMRERVEQAVFCSILSADERNVCKSSDIPGPIASFIERPNPAVK